LGARLHSQTAAIAPHRRRCGAAARVSGACAAGEPSSFVRNGGPETADVLSAKKAPHGHTRELLVERVVVCLVLVEGDRSRWRALVHLAGGAGDRSEREDQCGHDRCRQEPVCPMFAPDARASPAARSPRPRSRHRYKRSLPSAGPIKPLCKERGLEPLDFGASRARSRRPLFRHQPAGRRADIQTAAARPESSVQVTGPLAPAVACSR
jgi:hypothetical protein